MQISLTAETMKLLDFKQEEDGSNEAFLEEALGANQIADDGPASKDDRLVCQKITRFDGILITKVFFTNSSIYGRIMIT